MLTKEDRARMLIRAADSTDAKALANDVRRLLVALEEAERETQAADDRAWKMRLAEREREIDTYGPDI